jgi:cysteine desulfurase
MPYQNPFPKGVYFDNNATMPLLASARDAIRKALDEGGDIANPSSIHKPGQAAKQLVFQCKKELCEWLGTRDPEEWVFLSGATEALNAILKTFEGKPVAFSSVDHSAVFETVAHVKWENKFELKVDKNGQLDEKSVADFERNLEKVETCLLNWQLANNETGISFKLEVLEALVEKYNRSGKQKLFVLMDGAQALGKLDESYLRRALHLADYLVVSAHKFGGPMGIGALWMREGIPFVPLVDGGTQEKRRRAGTHNMIGIAGFYAALADWKKNSESYRTRMRALRDRAFSKLSQIEGFTLHGEQYAVANSSCKNSLCNTLNFHFGGCKDESLVLALDLEGFFLSSGSACNSGSLKPSRVLLEMGYTPDEALSSLRFCVGPQNTEEEIDLFCERIQHRVEHIRKSRGKFEAVLPEMKAAKLKVKA